MKYGRPEWLRRERIACIIRNQNFGNTGAVNGINIHETRELFHLINIKTAIYYPEKSFSPDKNFAMGDLFVLF